MAHVPLPLRGVAVLLLAASTVFGQSPEPPADFALDSISPNSPDLLRQFSNETHNPLLNLMVDGELTSFEAAPPKEGTKIKPTPQTQSESSATAPSDGCVLDGCADGIECPTVPNFLPFACSPPTPPCNCRKCLRNRSRGHCGGNGCNGGYGNPYLSWPGCPICFYGAPLVPCDGGCCNHWRGKCWGHKCCPKQGQGYPYGWSGCNTMCGDGFWGGDFCDGCMPFVAPPPAQKCRWCQRKQGCGHSGYGYPNCGYVFSGYCDGCSPYVAPPPPPQQSKCRWCQRKYSSCGYGYGGGYGYQGCGYPGWDGDGDGCGKHRQGFGLFRHCRCCQKQPYPNYGCSMMPSMDGDMFFGDGAFGSDF
jgi:hypothetical protein